MPRVAITFGNPDRLAPYEEALRAVFLEPVHNPESMAGLDGLLLTGGTDVDPVLYDEERAPEADIPDIRRDALERKLILESLELDRPIFAICRGLQIFNVVHGGSLIQHLPNAAQHSVRNLPRSADVHSVTVQADTALAAINGHGVRQVNSRHHQAVGRVAERLIISATAPDGVIEAIEHPGKRFALAVQWHPEDRVHSDPADLGLFQAFAAALKE